MTLHLYFYDLDPSHHHLLLYLTGTGTISPLSHFDHWSQRILKEGSILQNLMPLLMIPQWRFSALRIISKSLSRVSFLFHLIQALSPSNQMDFPPGPWTHLTPPHCKVITSALSKVFNSSKVSPPAWVKSLFQEVCSAQLRFSTHFL